MKIKRRASANQETRTSRRTRSKRFRLERRIFISSPRNRHLDKDHQTLRFAIIRKLKSAGFEPQVFGSDGFAEGFGPGETWSPAGADAVMRRCVGVVLLGFPIYESKTLIGGKQQRHVSEYCHYEGALARTLDLPVFAALEEGTAECGAFLPYAGDPILTIPKGAGKNWVNDAAFKQYLDRFLGKVHARADVFLAYPSKHKEKAKRIANRLKRDHVKVLDWHSFLPGDSVMRRIEEAARQTTGGIFLFTTDDRLETSNGRIQWAPRDNVVFEAGYFAHAKGKARTVILYDPRAKLPSDLGGDIYVPLEWGKNQNHMFQKIESFLASQL